MLGELAAGGGVPPAGGVVHSFTGTRAELDALLAVPGLYVGLNGCGLKTAENCAVAARIPLGRLLLETDAPWCALKAASPAAAHVRTRWPAAKRGGALEPGALVRDRTEPCTVVQVAEAYAGLAGIALAAVAAAAEANADALFWPPRP